MPPAIIHCSHEYSNGDTILCGFDENRPAVVSCKGRRERDDCPLHKPADEPEQPSPDAKPLEWEAELDADGTWQFCAGTTTYPTRNIRHDGYAVRYHGTHYRCWEAYFDGMTIKEGSLEECITACNEHERREG
jgi:hypothetical protein